MPSGAESLVTALADLGVSACFANPGTSEMHLVTALDREPRIRSVLCLFEGVVSGAADGFARISGRPSMTLLHLGSGLTNSGANLHNARRAHTPMINVIGDHAGYHLKYDAPLTSDIAGLAGPIVVWQGRIYGAAQAHACAHEAFERAMSLGGPVALILPADSAWSDLEGAPTLPAPLESRARAAFPVDEIAARVRAASKPVALVNGSALLGEGLAAAARLEAYGLHVFTDTFPARQERGAGRFAPHRLAYFAEMAMAELEGADLMVLVGASPPAAFFAYPGKPSLLVPDGCALETLCCASERRYSGEALSALADALGAPESGPCATAAAVGVGSGALTAAEVGAALARHMPSNAIIADDGVTSGLPIFSATVGAAPHDWLCLTGGAIGIGMPLALGASIAAPDRKVICLSGDGAGMYTNQTLWSMAREQTDVLTIIFANRSYRILNIEMSRTGAGNPGPAAQSMLSLDNPAIDWVMLAQALGVSAVRCETAKDFDRQFARLCAQKGPALIEAIV